MTLEEGASHEILSRWPEYKQRNIALMPDIYGTEYRRNMITGIELVRHHHETLEEAGETEWSIPAELNSLLDDLSSGAI